MDRKDVLARLDYWTNQEYDAWARIEECREKLGEVIAELALMEMNRPDEL